MVVRAQVGVTSEKMSKPDRILELRPANGKKTLSSTGLVDTRLFTGENKLHAIKDPATCFWYLKYESGIVPQPLKQHFTSFGALKKFAEHYFGKRNIVIDKVID